MLERERGKKKHTEAKSAFRTKERYRDSTPRARLITAITSKMVTCPSLSISHVLLGGALCCRFYIKLTLILFTLLLCIYIAKG